MHYYTLLNINILTIKSIYVPDSNFTVSPYGAHHWIQLPAFKSSECYTQIMSIHYVTQSPLIHVQDHQQGVRNYEGVSGLQEARVCFSGEILAVVVEFTPAQVPPPGFGVASNQSRVAHRVQGSVTCGHTHHCVRAPLAHGPAYFPHVQSPGVADAATDGVRALRHGVPVKHQLVVIFDEDVEGAVVVVPRVLDLDVRARGGHVQNQIQSGRLGVTQSLELQFQRAERWITHINGFNATRDFLPHAPVGLSRFSFSPPLVPPPLLKDQWGE